MHFPTLAWRQLRLHEALGQLVCHADEPGWLGQRLRDMGMGVSCERDRACMPWEARLAWREWRARPPNGPRVPL